MLFQISTRWKLVTFCWVWIPEPCWGSRKRVCRYSTMFTFLIRPYHSLPYTLNDYYPLYHLAPYPAMAVQLGICYWISIIPLSLQQLPGIPPPIQTDDGRQPKLACYIAVDSWWEGISPLFVGVPGSGHGSASSYWLTQNIMVLVSRPFCFPFLF